MVWAIRRVREILSLESLARMDLESSLATSVAFCMGKAAEEGMYQLLIN